MKTIIFILIAFYSMSISAQIKQDSVKLKSGARITKATFSEKIGTKVKKYKTVYLNPSTQELFVIEYDKDRKRYKRKPLPKNIEID